MIRNLLSNINNNCLKTCKNYFRTVIEVNNYLKDRSKPASEILANLLPEDAERLSKVKSYYKLALVNQDRIPENLTDIDYLEMLCLSNRQLRSYLNYRFKVEMHRKKEKKNVSLTSKSKVGNYFVNKITTSYENKSTTSFYYHRLINSILMGNQEVVIDASFEDQLTRHEVQELARQIFLCYSALRQMKDPFQLFITDMEKSECLKYDLEKVFNFQSNEIESIPIQLTRESYLEKFPDRQFIYLTPDSQNHLKYKDFFCDSVFVIGGIVDKSMKNNWTIAKARQQGIQHRSLPLDKYIKWNSGSKKLSLLHVLNILRVIRETRGDWTKTFNLCLPSSCNAQIDSTDYNKIYSENLKEIKMY